MPNPPSGEGRSPPAAPPTGLKAFAADLPWRYWLAAVLISGMSFAFLFESTIASLIRTWDTEPDYSHGFLVAPFAALLLWLRRDSFPRDSSLPGWGGLSLLAASFVVRYVGERIYMAPLSGWAIVFWVAGAVWLVAGRRALVWALPGILFLLFMVPLPWRFERAMSWHLQSVTTWISSFVLQCLGQPAIAESHTIFLGDHILEVEQACSGLRMFMGIAAVAFAFAVLHRCPWWEKLVLAVAVGPVAMLSNSIRVVTTGLLMQVASSEAAARFSHDAAGWAMIVVAAALFGLLVFYLNRLFVAVEVESSRELLRRPEVT